MLKYICTTKKLQFFKKLCIQLKNQRPIRYMYLNPRSKQTIKLSTVPAKQLQQAHDFISVSTQMRL